jgi:hypothetical protein
MIEHFKLNRILSAVIISTATFASAATAAPAQLASHQAVYDLKLEEATASGGIDTVRGRIVLRVEQQCDGLIMNQRMVLEIVNADGNVIVSDYLLSTWEDNKGEGMRFDMSNSLNGRSIEQFSGVAERSEDNAIVSFSIPEHEDIELPSNTMFPAEHTRKILEAAAAGQKLLSAKVYDGNGAEGLTDTLAVMGKRKTLTEAKGVLKSLDQQNYFPLQLSFFDLREQKSEPDYEIGMKMFENGIATDLHLKYHDFTLKGAVTKLEILSTEKCS